MGTGSHIHHIAVHAITARSFCCAGSIPGIVIRHITTMLSGPNTAPIAWRMPSKVISDFIMVNVIF
jgi:hypothetical protein